MAKVERNDACGEDRKGQEASAMTVSERPQAPAVLGTLGPVSSEVIEVQIADIVVGERFRKDMGDLDRLAAAIKEAELLQPIGITSAYRLVFGLRRLLAFRDFLGKQTIPARIVPMESLFVGEILENTMRQEYTVIERVAIADALRSYRHGGDRRSNQARKCDVESLTVDQAAKRAGLGGKDTYLRAKEVITKGVPELVQAMGCRKLPIAAASEIAKLSPEDQLASVRRGKKVVARDPDDFYPTPSYVTEALLRVETFGQQIWEPACGNGAISKVLEAAGYEVLSSDLKDRGYGQVEDFLTSNRRAKSIVTNPPFKLADEFVRKALESTSHKVAMLLPMTFLEGPKRANWLQTTPLKTVHIFPRRVNFCKNGEEDRKNGRFVFAWFVWEHGYSGKPTISWIDGAKQGSGRSMPHRDTHSKQLAAAVETERLPSPAVNTVSHGDCRDLIRALPDASANLCVTSPPYAEQRKREYPSIPEKDYPDFTVQWMSCLRDKLADDGSVLIVIDPRVRKGVVSDYVRRTIDALRQTGWHEHRRMIWLKPDAIPMGHKQWPRHCYEDILWFSKSPRPFCDPKACGRWSPNLSVNGYSWSKWTNGDGARTEGIARTPDVFVAAIGSNERGVQHPARYPVILAEQLIATFCPPGGVVLDPFCGSGSTLVAAEKLGSAFYGFEIVERFCEIVRSRLHRNSSGEETPAA